MAEMFLKPLIEKLIEKLAEEIIGSAFRYVKYQFRWQEHAKEELEKLIETLPQIEAVVHFASSQEQFADHNRVLNEWQWQLRDAIDDAYDVLDELEYMKLEKQVTKNKKLRRKRSILKSGLVKIGERVFNNDPALKRLEKAVQNLIQVSTRVDTFYHLVKDTKNELQKQQLELHAARETGALPKNDLIGRVKEKELLREWLKNPSKEHGGAALLYKNISLLSIVGHGGMGKTTMLQHVYQEEEITKEFHPQMWVCVSNNFNAKKVIADMLECLMKERPRLETLVALQGALNKEVMSKKFLLVLDDIWEDDEEKDKRKWEDVLAPLASGGFGSKIMATTRTDSVAVMFAKVIKKKKEFVKLEGLEEDECLQLLNSHAFAGVDPHDYAHLGVIAGEIVKKLSRSPLAAKVIGGVLNSKLDERHWKTVLKSNLLDQNSISSILTLSYMVLPNHLRNCFAICCMFPQDHKYDKDDLVRMWIALGFIHPSLGMIMEDIGERYFDALVKKNLFDKVGDDYKMHDLIHESASKFFAQECGKLVGDHENSFLEISDTIRHLSVQNAKPNILRKIEKFKHLHSLFMIYEDSNHEYNQNLGSSLIEIFKASTSLRVLYICIVELKMMPEEIKYLKHLRYLNLFRVKLERSPRSLSNLYHMQYMILCRGMDKGDDFLPSDINNLSNLRYMELPKNCISSICGIGKLKYLQELHGFDIRNEHGYRIGELKNMNDLYKLGIYCLENVKDAEEAYSAKLYDKTRLKDLNLCWSNTDSRNIDLAHENVLDKLQPLECLRNLSIKGYMGARSAIWMKNAYPISHLYKIELKDCREWETLPPLGQLHFLKFLKLCYMPKVKWLESKFNGNHKYRPFPLLEELHIWGLEALEDWFEGGVASEYGCLFPCLIELEIHDCSKLKELPSLPPKLNSLKIIEVGWKTLNFCSNSNPIPLELLAIYGCRNITSLPLADEIARLAALRYLEIEECPNLISLGEMPTTTNNCRLMLSDLWISDPSVLLMEPLRSIISLKKLCIEGNESVVSFPDEVEQWFLNVNVSSSLFVLEFYDLKSLESLPSSLESLSSLEHLYISNVPMLRELSNLPPYLKSLTIGWKCHPELKERYREDGGSDRNKIAHIPHISID